MSGWIVLDFETSSAIDLPQAGADRYAEDITTEVLSLVGQNHRGDRERWHPGLEMGPVFRQAIAQGYMFIAWNARFERAIWRHLMHRVYGWPDIPLKLWHDTMAVAAMLTLPQKLEKALPIMRIPHLKDTDGSRITIGLSRLKKGYYPPLTDETLERVGTYNEADIDSQVGMHLRIGWLPPSERRTWVLDQIINDRGVKLDQPLVQNMQLIVDKAKAPLMKEFADLTGGLGIGQVAKIGDWLHEQGVFLPNMQKDTLAKVLGEDEDGEEIELDEWETEVALPPEARRALHIRQLIGSASVKKLSRMAAVVGEGGRARGLLQYHAAGTGRWGGRLIQPQNFPRGSLDFKAMAAEGYAVDDIIGAIMTGDPDRLEAISGKPPVETVVSSLRYALIAEEEHEFVAGDFAQIEARVVLALAGQWDKVDLFASGACVYCNMAESIYGRPITKTDLVEYTIGKSSVLGLGFRMGAPKFHNRYAPDQDLEFAQEVVNTYRKTWAPMIPKVWYALERAATDTVHEGTPHEAYGVTFEKVDLWLTARLPNEYHRLWYFNPQPTWRAMPWDADDVRPSWSYQANKQGKRVTIDAHGGLLTENVVQALARDLMVEAAFRAEANGFPIVLTVHDELLTEPHWIDADVKALEQIMSERSDWAKAMKIPVATEGWVGPRYKK